MRRGIKLAESIAARRARRRDSNGSAPEKDEARERGLDLRPDG